MRIWKVVRSQADIMRHMRWASGLENQPDLVAYWKFNEPDGDEGQFRCVLLCVCVCVFALGCGVRLCPRCVCVCVCVGPCQTGGG